MKALFGPVPILVFVFLFGSGRVSSVAEDNRAQYPWWLSNSYLDFGVAYVDYPFLPRHLEPGYPTVSVHAPPTGVRVTLFGHNFTERFSAQIIYMRPVKWVKYMDAVRKYSGHSITNVGGFTVRSTVPLKGPFSVYLEGGFGIVTRSRFKIDDHNIVEDANYTTVLSGLGLKYRLNNTWDLQVNGAYLPSNDKFRQPHTAIVSTGAVFNIRPLRVEQVQANIASDILFPKNLIQVGIATNGFGVGVNRLVSGGTVPIFWGGLVEVETGSVVRYQRNVFHTKKIFGLDLGLGVGTWRSTGQGTKFMTFSAFPQFRFVVLRSKPADLYLNYSLAGPTYITKTKINGQETGKRFTFQDLMGLGFYLGQRKNINLEVGIGHYSNGNLFPRNAGVKIPLTFNVGYAF